MDMSVKQTTPGPWIVTTTDDDEIIVVQINKHQSIQKRIALVGQMDVNFDVEGDKVIYSAENEALSNAALIAIAPEMLDALIAIQEAINPAYECEIDLTAMNTMISDVFTRLAIEAGEL